MLPLVLMFVVLYFIADPAPDGSARRAPRHDRRPGQGRATKVTHDRRPAGQVAGLSEAISSWEIASGVRECRCSAAPSPGAAQGLRQVIPGGFPGPRACSGGGPLPPRY